MASEVRASGVDLSFAPVVDLGRGNRAIGDRAFSRRSAGRRRIHPRLRARHARAPAWPRRSSISRATARCWRTRISTTPSTRARSTRCARNDLVPFVAGIEAGADAVMLAHVTYPAGRAGAGRLFAALDRTRSCASEMGFRGVVFSDDIGMAAAFSAGGVEGAHRRAPGRRLRRGAGLPSGAGRGIAGARWQGRTLNTDGARRA